MSSTGGGGSLFPPVEEARDELVEGDFFGPSQARFSLFFAEELEHCLGLNETVFWNLYFVSGGVGVNVISVGSAYP
jgi:hypothetical protein